MFKILLADDEELLCFLVRDVLEMDGYEVRTVSDGEACIAQAKEFLPDAIICDMKLGDITGFDVLRAVREDKMLANTKFVFLTANVSDRDMKAGLAAGADQYITKPFQVFEFVQKISTLLGAPVSSVSTSR